MNNQSFGVEDIRRVRDEDAARYQENNMTIEEITRDIHERAQDFYKMMDKVRQEKAARQAV